LSSVGVALGVEQHRRIVGGQQALRVVGIGQGQQPVAGLRRPLQAGVHTGAAVMTQQALGQRQIDHGGKRALAGLEDRLRQAEGLEQVAPGFTADAGDQRETEPGSEFEAIRRHALRVCVSCRPPPSDGSHS
jgi:hypothetical protein